MTEMEGRTERGPLSLASSSFHLFRFSLALCLLCPSLPIFTIKLTNDAKLLTCVSCVLSDFPRFSYPCKPGDSTSVPLLPYQVGMTIVATNPEPKKVHIDTYRYNNSFAHFKKALSIC